MHSFILQDWVTIRGGSGVSSVIQPEHEWLDLEPYQDVVFWLEVTEQTGSPSFAYQTSPTADDSLFQTMASATVTVVSGPAFAVTQVLMLSATVPLARFVRWKLTGTPTWDASFRIMVAANAPGL